MIALRMPTAAASAAVFAMYATSTVSRKCGQLGLGWTSSAQSTAMIGAPTRAAISSEPMVHVRFMGRRSRKVAIVARNARPALARACVYCRGMGLEFDCVSHRYGRDEVLDEITFAAAPGEITCLLGASGSGKTTLLRLAAGLERTQAGTIRLDGEVLSGPGIDVPPERRPVGLVFQEHVLFPHKTVLENAAFGLRGLDSQQRRAIAQSELDAVGLGKFSDRYPDTLSGGQQQRVALARALAPAPRVMLLDEPFANVDATLRRDLREDARRVLRESGGIAVIVTHDPDEALELADRIAVMDQGRIVQIGTPDVIWRRPAERAVVSLFGRAQHLRGTVEASGVTTAFGALQRSYDGVRPGDAVDVLVRPSAVALAPASDASNFIGQIEDMRFLGRPLLGRGRFARPDPARQRGASGGNARRRLGGRQVRPIGHVCLRRSQRLSDCDFAGGHALAPKGNAAMRLRPRFPFIGYCIRIRNCS